MKPETIKKWSQRIRDFEESGLPIDAYAARERLSAKSLSWWRWHLAKSDAPKKAKRRRNALEFVRIDEPNASPSRTTSSCEIVFASGHTLRIPESISEERLLSFVSIVGSL